MRKRGCFISFAHGDQLEVLQRVLDSFDVTWGVSNVYLGQSTDLEFGGGGH